MIRCPTEIPPTPKVDKTKVAKLENEMHQYTEKLEAMMRILQNLPTPNSDPKEASVPG